MTTYTNTPVRTETVQPLAILKPAAYLFTMLLLLTGVIYPILMTIVAKTVFPEQSQGSLIHNAQQQVVGSKQIGQLFDQPQYLWGRPSASQYDSLASGGSNLGPLNPQLVKDVSERMGTLQRGTPQQTQPIPADLVMASASGLDPHISPQAAHWQAARIAQARGIPVAQVQAIIAQHTQGRQLGILGEPVVNVLEVNLALDQQQAQAGQVQP